MCEVMPVIFGAAGPANTLAVVETAITAARQRGIRQIVLASSGGTTARAFLPYAGAFHIVSVGYCHYVKPGQPCMMEEDTQKVLREGGIQLLFGTHVLSGAEHHLRTTFGGAYPVEIMAHTLSMLGAGVKVAIEVTVAALDAGLIQPEPTIGVGGSGRGADASVILTPDASIRFLNTRVHEILCKPGLYRNGADGE